MNKTQIKTKARGWLTLIEKILKEHEAIEEKMSRPDDHEEFIAVGMALAGTEAELQALIDA